MALLNLYALIFSLYLGFIWHGSASLHDVWVKFLADSQIILPALPLYLLFCMVRAAFKVRKEQREIGQWFDGKFVYNQPRLLATFHITEADNDNPKTFKLHEREIGSVVELKVVTGGMDKAAQWQIRQNICKEQNVPLENWALIGRPESYTAVYSVIDDKPFWLYTRKTVAISSYIIHIYQVSWSAINEYDAKNHP